MDIVSKMSDHIYVIKRNGVREPVSFDQVLSRIQKLSQGLEHVNPDLVAQKVCTQIQDGIKTSELDEFAAETCAMMQARHHYNYGKLAARLVIDNHQKNTPNNLSESARILFEEGVVSETYYKLAQNPDLEGLIDYSRDFMFEYFGFKTLENGYLLRRRDGPIVERPQHLWMRVALHLHQSNIQKVRETYDALSQGYFIHATPTLFNSGTNRPQLSSCFLLQMEDDSIEGIYNTLGDCAQISKWSGGIGLSVHNIRAKGSKIKGTNGKSTGLVPMLKVFNDTAKYVNQGGKRPGSFAIYLEPWHADIEDFLRLRLNTGTDDERARDLFYGLWIPDLFMERVEQDGLWSLMCPDECPGLSDAWGDDFSRLYNTYERDHAVVKTIPAKKLWQMIVDSQIQTGGPYLLYKDAANRKSNQQNLGTIKSSNLCVAPETLVTTTTGEFPIKDLVGKEDVRVWNGDQWSQVVVKQTGANQKLLKITVKTSNGIKVVYCTEYHKFILTTYGPDGLLYDSIANSTRVEAKDLKPQAFLRGWIDPKTFSAVSALVVSVEDTGRYDDTYCFNEPLNHAGVFNGILTGNCSEIIEYTSSDETAVCNLGSLALPKFIKNGVFDFEMLRHYTSILAKNLDIVIDKTYYPTEKCKRSNLRHRPIGIGVQGLADTFAILRLPWTSPEATKLNREIFENIYFAAATTSMLGASHNDWRGIAINAESTYSTFAGSPMSKGKLQCDLWGETPISTYLDWDSLRSLCKNGVRNSLLIAPMPTASTSQILGNNECFEPFTSNLYTRRVLSGDFIVVNKYLVEDLVKNGLWTADVRSSIIANNGSVANIEQIPAELRELYKTSWEIPMKTLINMAADRGAFICQSQSLNLFLAEPTPSKVSSMHFYAWKKGLKTGLYYLRTKAAAKAQQFTVEPPACVTCSA